MHVLALALLLFSPQGDEDLVFRSYPVAHLTRTIRDDLPTIAFGDHLPRSGEMPDPGSRFFGDPVREGHQLIQAEVLADWMRDLLMPSPLPEGWSIEGEGTRLDVIADAATHERCGAFLNYLDERVRSERFRVTVRGYEVRGSFGGSTSWLDGLGRQAVRALLDDKGPARFVETAIVEAGRRVQFGRRHVVHYLQDFDAEIAQDSSTTDPLMADMQFGSQVSVLVHPLQDPAAVLARVCIDDADPPSFRRIPLHAKQVAPIDLPELNVTCLQHHARVVLGGALVLPVLGLGDRSMVYFVEIDPITERPKTRDDLALFPLEHLNQEKEVRFHAPNGLEEKVFFWDQDEIETLDIDQVWDWIRQTHEEVFDREDGGRIVPRGPWLTLVHTNDEVTRSAREIVANIEGEEARTAHVRFEVHPVRDGREGAVRTSEALAFVELFGRCNMSSRAAIGTERLMLVDYDSVIAQEASLHDPVVDAVFLGTWLELAPRRIDTSGTHVQVHWNVRQETDRPQYATGPGGIGPIEGLVHEEVDATVNVDLVPDQPILLGRLPKGRDGQEREAWLRLVAVH